MLSASPPSNLLTRVNPNLLQRPVPRAPRVENGGSAEIGGLTTKPTPGSAGADLSARTEGSGEKAATPGASQSTQKTIVDQRTTDAGSIRITVVAYSDGSSETLREIKNTDDLSRAVAQLERPVSLSDKGLVVDKLA